MAAAAASAWSGGSVVCSRAAHGSLARLRGAGGGSARADRASRTVRGTTHPASEMNSSR